MADITSKAAIVPVTAKAADKNIAGLDHETSTTGFSSLPTSIHHGLSEKLHGLTEKLHLLSGRGSGGSGGAGGSDVELPRSRTGKQSISWISDRPSPGSVRFGRAKRSSAEPFMVFLQRIL